MSPRAPDLWGHPSWKCPSCSRVIPTTGMDSRGLGFSLTDNWCVVWGPPFMAQPYCLSHRCLISHPLTILPRTHQDILVIDTNPCPLVGPNLRDLIITSGERRSMTDRYNIYIYIYIYIYFFFFFLLVFL